MVNLIPLGVDEHSYYPGTTLPRDLVRADLVVVNGYYLEESLLGIVVENVRDGVPVVAAAPGLALLEGGHVHEFVEGDIDRAAVDAAVREIGAIVEASGRGEIDAVEAIDQVDRVVHRLPSRSRTEAVREIDRHIHDVPRGQLSAEDAVAAITAITRGYTPAPGPDAAARQVTLILDRQEDGELDAEQAMSSVDQILDALSLDQRDAVIREVDAAVAVWAGGETSADEALIAVLAALEGHGSAAAAGSMDGDDVDDLVFAEGDPHLWLDARNMAAYAENIRDALIRVDPAGTDEYRARAVEVVAELDSLHEELVTTLAQVPDKRRQLIVFHDAFQYFAAAYNFEVIATVAPANPNQARSAAAIAEIIEVVRASGAPTVFREPQYSSQSLDLIAADSGATIGIIHSIPSPEVPTYAEMMRANASALVEGLTAGG